MQNTLDTLALFRGKPLFDSVRTTTTIPHPAPDVFFRELRKSWDARYLTNNGPCVLELEKQLATFHNAPYCVSFSSGFMALAMCLRAMALPEKTEVILPSLAYRRMADILLFAGLKPVFADVDERTLAISPQTVLPLISEHTALLLAVHPITLLADIKGFEELAIQEKLPLLWDSVEACGASFDGRPIGTFGDAEAFSLHASKLINACEGGYITTRNGELAGLLKKMRSFGFAEQDSITCFGGNGKINELHAATGIASLARIEELRVYHKHCHAAYDKIFTQLPGLKLIPYAQHEMAYYKRALVQIDDEWPLSRTLTLDLLNAENCYARTYYFPPLHHAPHLKLWANGQHLPVTDRLTEKFFLMPMGTTISTEDITKIGELLQFCYTHASQIIARHSAEKNV